MPKSEFFARSPAAPFEPPAWLKMDAAALKAALAATPDRHPIDGPPPIRAARKAEEWRAAIYRAWGYLSGRVREPGEAAKLDELLERTLKEGPDFAKVRRNATFARAPVVAYSRESAAAIMRQAREIERESYAHRAKGAHGGALGRMALNLLEWFCFTMWPRARYGMVPSIAHICSGARMSRPTAVAAMATLERFGLLTIQRRRKLIQTAFGPKLVQDTSAYVLNLADDLPAALAPPAVAKTPPAGAEKRGIGSEFTSRPAIRIEHFISMPDARKGRPNADYEPLLE
jgi:hypothetical protein